MWERQNKGIGHNLDSERNGVYIDIVLDMEQMSGQREEHNQQLLSCTLFVGTVTKQSLSSLGFGLVCSSLDLGFTFWRLWRVFFFFLLQIEMSLYVYSMKLFYYVFT